jgi:cytochrome c-type biogenesis protein CcmE
VTRAKRKSGRAKFYLGGAVIIVAVAWLILSSIGSSSAYYVTVGELMTGSTPNRVVRAAGDVVSQTIDWDPQQMVLRFEIADETGTMPVLYKGPRPDLLEDGAHAVVEGRYGSSGIFEATAVLLKCPSKYVEE